MNYQVIIVIGLPGSGKTTLSKLWDDYTIFDDCISTFYNGKALSAIKSGSKVCLIDPRLCNYVLFEKYMQEIERYVDRKEIILVLFSNDPVNCLNNVKNSNKRGLEATIDNYTKIYNLNNYKDCECVNVPVYSVNK